MRSLVGADASRFTLSAIARLIECDVLSHGEYTHDAVCYVPRHHDSKLSI